MSNYINKVVVMGAGVMGASLAGLFASVGVEAVMLDIVPPQGLTEEEKAKGLTENSPEYRNRFSIAGYEKAKKPRNMMLYSEEAIKNLRYGNTTDNMDEIKNADWIIEAVSENINVKQIVLKQIEPHIKPGAIVSSNTSGVNVHSIVDGLGDNLKKCFMGTHFFNPPRWMALFEMIPTKWTDMNLYKKMEKFAEDVLGKVVVHAKDTPNFVGNRIAVYGGIQAMKLGRQFGFDIPTLDFLTGPIMGNPKSATCKTADMVGLDIFLDVAGNVLNDPNIPQSEKEEYDPPQFFKEMVSAGIIGDKAKKGFYKKEMIDGKRTTLCYDIDTKTYVNKKADTFETVEAAKASGNKYAYMNWGDTPEQKFTYERNKRLILYSARITPDIVDDYKEIDKALVAGFNREVGVFQLWDKLGVERCIAAWEADGEEIPKWVKDRVAAGKVNFYEEGAVDSKYLTLKNCNVVKGNADASIKDIGDGVLCVEFHSTLAPVNPITQTVSDMLNEATEMLKGDNWVGLVVGTEGKTFCAGADLLTIYGLADEKDWDGLDKRIRGLQAMMLGLKYAARPVIAAPFQQTLGGGAELVMHCTAAVPHTDTFMGLVEVGVGLLPAGGGCAEMLVRQMERCYNDQKKSRYDAILQTWQNIATARVNVGADASVDAGYLSRGTYIERNKGKLFQSAKDMVLHTAKMGYRPGCEPTIKVSGEYGYGAIQYRMLMMRNGNFTSDYDFHLSDKIARVVTGGNLPYGTEVPLQHIRDMEREAFKSLCGEEKTKERIQGMLLNNKPVRN